MINRMTMKRLSILLTATTTMANDCLAFQKPLPASMRVRTLETKADMRLQYQNKTEEDTSYHNELDRQLLAYSSTTYSSSSSVPGTLEDDTIISIDETVSMPLARVKEEEEEEEEIDEDDPLLTYNEDGTTYIPVVPTVELLREWTQEYIDAVDLAGGGITRLSASVEDLMADDYVFTSPTIGPINKKDFVQLMRFYLDSGFDISSAVPDFTTHYDGWHQDPHEPFRIWAVVRYSGTHTGTAVVPQSGLSLTPPNTDDHPLQFMTGPEMHSFLWTADKKILWQSMGHVGDIYTGSNQGKGGLEGLMVSMGLPTLYLDSTAPLRKSMAWFSQFSDNGKEPRSTSPYSSLPQWWHERKTYDLNVHK